MLWALGVSRPRCDTDDVGMSGERLVMLCAAEAGSALRARRGDAICVVG